MREKLNPGSVILIASLLVGVLFGMPLSKILKNFLIATIDLATLRLVGIIVLIGILGNLLTESGILQKINSSVEAFIKDRRLTLIVPSVLMGLLPAPAGTMLSAPAVEESGNRMGLDAETKTFLNYWFRHIWEYVWPVYPGLILAVTILNVPLHKLAITQFPLTLAAIFAGCIFGLRKISGEKNLEKEEKKIFEGILKFFFYAWPIFAIMFLVLILKLDLILSLSVIVIFAFFTTKIDKKSLPSILKNSASWKIILLIVSVMVFKRILEVSGVLPIIPGLFKQLRMPPIVILFSIPFIIGFLTGLTMIFIGVSFPLFLPLIGTNNPDLVYAMLIFAGGFCGCLLSPLHLCLVVSAEYFKADFARVYKMVILPVVLIGAVAFAIVLVHKFFGIG